MATYFGHRTKWRGGTKHQTGGSNPRAWNHLPPARPGPSPKYGFKHKLDLGKNDWSSDRNPVRPKWGGPADKSWADKLNRARRAQQARQFARAATRWAGRVNPYVRAGTWVLDAAQLMGEKEWGEWSPSRPGKWDIPEGWVTDSMCNDPDPITCTSTLRSANPCIDGQFVPCDGGKSDAVGYWSEPRTYPPPRKRHVASFHRLRGYTTPHPTYSPPRPRLIAPLPSLKPNPDMSTGPELAYPPNPRPAPYTPPYQEPATEIEVTPRGPKRPKPVIHTKEPPSPNVKEKKYVFDYGAAGRIYGALTEADDAADAIIDAMPKGSKCRNQRTLHGKWACIIDNADDIDWTQALANLAAEQFQDKVIGKFGQLQKRGVQNAAKHGYYNNPRGLGSGGWSWRNH